MSGCLRISKESIFTGLNNFSTYSILDTISDEYFDFTEKELKPELTYREMDDMNNIYSLLLLTGYLKIVKECEDNEYELIIPNKEVYEIYKQSFMSYFKEYTNARKNLLYQELVDGNTLKANVISNDILMKSISYYDNQESLYHGFLVGLFNEYEIKSNKEASEGRFDLCVLPDSILETVIVIEFKHSKSTKELEEDAKKGAQQIVDRKYMKEIEYEGYLHVVGYGISFYKKQCYIVNSK